MLVCGEGERVGRGAGVDGGNELTVVDAVDADEIGGEVGDPEGGVIAGNDSMDRLIADHVGTEDLIVPGIDLGDGVGAEVGDEDLATVGFHGEMDGSFADVEHGEKVVG